MRNYAWPAWVRFIPVAVLAAILLAVLYSGPLQSHLEILSSQGMPESAGAKPRQLKIAAPSGLAAELLQRTGVFMAQEPSQGPLPGATAPEATAEAEFPTAYPVANPESRSLTHKPELLPGYLLNLFQTRDCCAATAPWALGNNDLQGAIMCPDAARVFLEQNPDFVLLGVALVNSDVFMSAPSTDKRRLDNQDKANARNPVKDRSHDDDRNGMRNDSRGGTRVQKVGIAHKRAHQVRMAELRFSQTVELYPMIPQALPFALHDGVVDSVILDLAVASGLGGEITPWTGEEMVTQVFVVSRVFADSPDFALFAQAYEKARDLTEQKYKGQGVFFPSLPTMPILPTLEVKANFIQGKYTQ